MVSSGETKPLNFTVSGYAEGSISMECKEFSHAWISGYKPDGNRYMYMTVGSDGRFRFPIRQDIDTDILGHAYTTNEHSYRLEKEINAGAGGTVNISWSFLPGPCDVPFVSLQSEAISA